MSNYDYDDADEPPAQVWLQLQRQKAAERNFVTPAAPLAKAQPVTIDAVPAWLTPAQPVDVTNAWQPLPGAKEATSAVDRAKGLQLRVVPFLGLYALAGVVVGGGVWMVAANVPVAALLAVLTFAGMGIATYSQMNSTDYQHSGAGVERHRIDSATYLAELELEHKARMQEKALDAYLRRLERSE